MLRATTLISVLIMASGAAFAQQAAPPEAEPKPDTVQVHGKALTLSCAEWSRQTDGSWNNVGPLLVGEETVKAVTLRGATARPLEQKCNGAPSSALAPPAEKPRHQHHHCMGPRSLPTERSGAPRDERALRSSCVIAGLAPALHAAPAPAAATSEILLILHPLILERRRSRGWPGRARP